MNPYNQPLHHLTLSQRCNKPLQCAGDRKQSNPSKDGNTFYFLTLKVFHLIFINTIFLISALQHCCHSDNFPSVGLIQIFYSTLFYSIPSPPSCLQSVFIRTSLLRFHSHCKNSKMLLFSQCLETLRWNFNLKDPQLTATGTKWILRSSLQPK